MKTFFIIAAVAGFTACTQSANNQTHLSEASTPASFKLYSEAHVEITPSCDFYTQLNLDSSALIASMENKLAGTCELALLPDPRSYNLSASTDGCGAVIYKGQNALRSIEITDNRTNTCEIPLPALVVVTEKTVAGAHTYYSYDKQADQPVVPTAKKFFCSGVGGTDEWTIYVDLNKKLAGFFDNDSTVVVPMTDFKLLESNPPQELYIFNGADTGGGDNENLAIYFNATTLTGTLILAVGTDDEHSLTAENGCVADDDIDLEN